MALYHRPSILVLLPYFLCFLSGTSAREVQFALQHVFHHGVNSNAATLHNLAVPPSHIHTQQNLAIKTINAPIRRLKDRHPSTLEPILAEARQETGFWPRSSLEWVTDEVAAPDVTDRDTVINFALMAANAYDLVPGSGTWENLDPQFGFNTSLDFGWHADGLRGHIYADESNSTVIIGIKGTSTAVYDGANTTTADKENDNLYFSCCCAQQGQYTWRQVCSCATSTYGCNNTCLIQNLREDHRYYQAARYLYSNVTAMYPQANVWVTGHSLGGAVSSLLGLTYGLPTLTFEAPGDALPASRLGIPVPPESSYVRSMTGTYHFGHTADPIYMGTCTGISASCTWAGYAFESQCHAGQMCTYDTVTDLSWRVGIWRHGIREVIKDVLRAYQTVPKCIADTQCIDCYNWKFYESNSSDTTTSSLASSTRSRTRTESCETPGWWGCRDETMTSGTSTVSMSTSSAISATSTCSTPGWFWCKDKPTSSARLSQARPGPNIAMLKTSHVKSVDRAASPTPTSASNPVPAEL